jgi:hypothetical protein
VPDDGPTNQNMELHKNTDGIELFIYWLLEAQWRFHSHINLRDYKPNNRQLPWPLAFYFIHDGNWSPSPRNEKKPNRFSRKLSFVCVCVCVCVCVWQEGTRRLEAAASKASAAQRVKIMSCKNRQSRRFCQWVTRGVAIRPQSRTEHRNSVPMRCH